MRVLGVDFGFKRIGLAVVDDDARIPGTRPALQASGSLQKDARQISGVAARESADLVVVGLPVQPDGEEGKMARICRMLGAQLEAEGLQVRYVDESLSSVEAEGRLVELDLKASQRKKRRDGEAAALILERYMSEQAR